MQKRVSWTFYLAFILLISECSAQTQSPAENNSDSIFFKLLPLIVAIVALVGVIVNASKIRKSEKEKIISNEYLKEIALDRDDRIEAVRIAHARETLRENTNLSGKQLEHAALKLAFEQKSEEIKTINLFFDKIIKDEKKSQVLSAIVLKEFVSADIFEKILISNVFGDKVIFDILNQSRVSEYRKLRTLFHKKWIKYMDKIIRIIDSSDNINYGFLISGDTLVTTILQGSKNLRCISYNEMSFQGISYFSSAEYPMSFVRVRENTYDIFFNINSGKFEEKDIYIINTQIYDFLREDEKINILPVRQIAKVVASDVHFTLYLNDLTYFLSSVNIIDFIPDRRYLGMPVFSEFGEILGVIIGQCDGDGYAIIVPIQIVLEIFVEHEDVFGQDRV